MGWMSSSSTTTSSVSPEQRFAQGTAMNYGLHAANQPFQQYQGPWTAAFRPELLKAGNMMYQAPQIGADNINSGANLARVAGTYTPQVVNSQNTGAYGGDQFMGRYFNPFLQNVGGQMVADMGRARTQQIIADEDKALAAGAYGGSRHGVMDAETSRGFYDRLGANLSNLYADGFKTAAGFGQQDAQRYTDVDRANADRRLTADTFNSQRFQDSYDMKLRAGQALAGIGDMQHDNWAGDASQLAQYGQFVQNYDQAAIDRDRERFNEWRDYPMRQSQIINQAAGLVQGGGTSTQTQNPSLMQGAGSILGTAAMAMMLFSDENIKSDVRELGSEDDVLRGIKRTPVKTWRYDPRKGGPNDGGKPHIGPMAQDVKRNLGIGDGRSMPVVDVLGAHHAAISALAKKVDRKNVSDVKIKRKTKGK